MAKIKVIQVKSAINRPQRQKLTLQALGLGKLNRTVEHEATPQILGMVKKVEHMVKIQLPGVKILGLDAADALAIAICHAFHLNAGSNLELAIRKAKR